MDSLVQRLEQLWKHASASAKDIHLAYRNGEIDKVEFVRVDQLSEVCRSWQADQGKEYAKHHYKPEAGVMGAPCETCRLEPDHHGHFWKTVAVASPTGREE